ncbi:hypothetical protein GF385_02835 [Candidatus Dependentiae bacterium]|nr:hypothetical protein [Candidatus Dependentiae bacterium]
METPRDLGKEICYKVCRIIIGQLDPEKAHGIDLESVIDKVEDFFEERKINFKAFLNTNKLKSFLLKNRKRLLEYVGVEGVSKKDYKKAVNDFFKNKRPKNKFRKCLSCSSKCLKGIVAIIFCGVLVYLIVKVIDNFYELGQMDFGECLVEFKGCFSKQLNLSIKTPEIPDIPDIPKIPDI